MYFAFITVSTSSKKFTNKCFKKLDGSTRQVLGPSVNVIVFNSNKYPHVGLSNINTDRYVMVASVYLTLRNEVTFTEGKPINSFCELNPFTSLS